MQYEASRIYRGLLDVAEDLIGPKFREMIDIGLALSETTYRDDHGARRLPLQPVPGDVPRR